MMTSIQITFDERLLAALDRDPEVKREGRSAVLRKAAADYLSRRRRTAIAEAYGRAYGKDRRLGDEYAGWEDQGAWPSE